MLKWSTGVNDYATVVEPDKHEDERQQLISEGYMSWGRYKVENEDRSDFGKIEELWMK